MGQVTYGEQAAPAAPLTGVITYATVATPSILRVIDDAGNDRAVTGSLAPTAWTMGVSFGGGTTGITYGTRTTFYQRIGNLLFVYGYMELTAKGSSTGAALITGLPAAAIGTAGLIIPVTIRADLLTGITGMLMGYVAPSATTIVLQFLGTGTATSLTDAHFTNTTNLSIMAVYQVA